MNSDPLSLTPFGFAVAAVILMLFFCIKGKRWPENTDYFAAATFGLSVSSGVIAVVATFNVAVRDALADARAYLFFGGLACFVIGMESLKSLVKAHLLHKRITEKE